MTVQQLPKKVWTCPKCKRKFRTTRATHSCSYYPVSRHLMGKSPEVRMLYKAFIERLRNQLDFTIESLPCCIHLAHNVYTFAGVYVMKDRLRLHIALPASAPDMKLKATARLSAQRYLYSIDILDRKDLDSDLFALIRKSAVLSHDN